MYIANLKNRYFVIPDQIAERYEVSEREFNLLKGTRTPQLNHGPSELPGDVESPTGEIFHT